MTDGSLCLTKGNRTTPNVLTPISCKHRLLHKRRRRHEQEAFSYHRRFNVNWNHNDDAHTRFSSPQVIDRSSLVNLLFHEFLF
jgi:hypothetical protein